MHQQTQQVGSVKTIGPGPAFFPFELDDLDFWLIEREDGTVVKFTVDRKRDQTQGTGYQGQYTQVTGKQSLSAYCKHDPAKEPVFTAVKGDRKVSLWIADAAGTRVHKNDFDLVIDAGDVLSIWKPLPPKPVLKGDAELVEAMGMYAMQPVETPPKDPRILQIDWWDRKAPPLSVDFWPDLAKRLLDDPGIEKVLTNCQGGHGRSGSTLVALMMCYTDYDALDAITHLRAVHCARAIESAIQHDYLDLLAVHLGREPNAHQAHQVKDFRERFLTEVTSKYAKPYQDRLKKEKE